MTQYVFGSGSMYVTPLQDSSGTAIANPTPMKLMELQEGSFDFSASAKKLYGQNSFPAAVGIATRGLGVKVKNARVLAKAWNTLFFGQTLAAGIIGVKTDTSGTAVPTTPFQLTPTVPGSGTWQADLGVIDANGNPMTRVASGPATGQYSVTAGVYTFAAADTAKIVYMNFRYAATSTTASKMAVANQPMGYAPTFSADLSVIYQGKETYFGLPLCVASKMGIKFQNDDFAIPEFEFEGMDNGAGNVMNWSTSE
jgi:hypothetical protein